ncbi:Fe-S oxidoreductase [Rhodoblastus sphagnicola]|uniref:Fe-S oxidoreductase n=1 Tax=Rhodoblastus sphagnicola TaxID=333368 RepID=A0A2S6N7H1_9HYPH|nr:(Fe-S)-binding protein [Rhodoblastus sphagnicola]MBB4196234.1 L-lactate dehydrogenase complex protein LldE [Rhodoblastus sphagnicola]PPQ30558.1 Fe-S oxidoreductase [Rhodoblastus sphagnicola]
MVQNVHPGGPRVGLFATCLVDMLRPNIGFSALELLRAAGCTVEIPKTQTCCGQPAYNSGDDASARKLARQVIEIFEGFDYLVAPSGSCAATIRVHYPDLFRAEPAMRARAEKLSAKTWELLSFLVDVRGFAPTGVSCKASATYHDTCSGLRELGIKTQPRALLSAIEGLEMRALEGEETCCGFGGTFCVKYSEISDAIVTEKAENVVATGADLLLGGDLGCLLNMAGKLRRAGAPIRVFHAAELLAGRAIHAIGEEKP